MKETYISHLRLEAEKSKAEYYRCFNSKDPDEQKKTSFWEGHTHALEGELYELQYGKFKDM